MKKILVMLISLLLGTAVFANNRDHQRHHIPYVPSYRGHHSSSYLSYNTHNYSFSVGIRTYPTGRWVTRYQQVYIPGYQYTTYDQFGNRIIMQTPGRYEMRAIQVWVNY